MGSVNLSYLPRFGAITKDGAEAVEGLVIGLKGANAAAVVDAVEQKLARIQSGLPENTDINVFYNGKGLIDTAIAGISDADAIGCVSYHVLVFFLRNIRASILVSLSIPIAALITFICLQLLGLSAT